MPSRREPPPSLPAEPPDGVRATRLALKEGNLVVFSVPLEPSPGAALERLSPAERAVLACLLEGLTNGEIAARRDRTVRTVAKQVEAIYRKLGVRSRAELAVRYG